jgi:tRNA pseudouridine55 synthase
LEGDKEYLATAYLGVATDSFDCDGNETFRSDKIPTLHEVEEVIGRFQGSLEQVPPMFSAKKIAGKRLYELARKGVVVERKPVCVQVTCQIVRYSYPELEFHVTCSKGCYIRSLAEEIGQALGSYAHLTKLRRLRSGPFSIASAIDYSTLTDPQLPISFISI